MPAPFYNKRFTFTQPDGSRLAVRGFGNQVRARFETLAGDPVAQDATLRQAEALPETPRIKTRWEERLEEKKRRARSFPEADATLAATVQEAVGDFVGLCLLIEFPDVPGTIPREEVDAFCNQRGYRGFGNNGSVFDYFFDNSAGRLRYTNVVAPYYRSRHPRAHYTDPAVPWPDRARELIREALEHHRARGFDFSGLTADGAGFLRALNVFYAGELVNQFRQGLWPHMSRLLAPFALRPGLRASDYQITEMGHELTLGTFCHENGHMICDFPDLYDLGDPGDIDVDSFGTGFYCLMGYGGDANPSNPAQVCAYLKHRAGWTESLTRITPGRSVTLNAGRNELALHEKSRTEYFLLEARLQQGRDAALPDAGLAIWHVDEDGSNENEQRTPALHYECSLEQADGRFDLENAEDAGDRDDLFPFGANDRFGDATTPNSRWWDGSSSGLEIRNIRRTGNAVTFDSE